jgi:phytoene synthase
MQQSRSITRKSASNLALAFILLPQAKRDAMSALYAFCREVDDVADEDQAPVESRRSELRRWREDLAHAYAGEPASLPVIEELRPVIQQYKLPREHFEALLDGVEMDLEIRRYADYPELELYCYRVASVVGLLSINIFGYRQPACQEYAVYLGKALQLTNILRDVKTDADRGRIYLPESELRRHRVPPEDILRGRYSEDYYGLAKSVAERARHFYKMARQSLPEEERPAMVAAELMGSVYWELLRKLEARRFDVFGPPVRLNKVRKLTLIVRAWMRLKGRSAAPGYGDE